MAPKLRLRMCALQERLTLQTIKPENRNIGRYCWKHIVEMPAPAELSLIASSLRLRYLIFAKGFSIVEKPKVTEKERKDAFAKIEGKLVSKLSMSLMSRNDLEVMHQATVIRLVDQRNTSLDTPGYQLVTRARFTRRS